eukprot:jgi/Mesen1/8587/ME000005S08556
MEKESQGGGGGGRVKKERRGEQLQGPPLGLQQRRLPPRSWPLPCVVEASKSRAGGCALDSGLGVAHAQESVTLQPEAGASAQPLASFRDYGTLMFLFHTEEEPAGHGFGSGIHGKPFRVMFVPTLTLTECLHTSRGGAGREGERGK